MIKTWLVFLSFFLKVSTFSNTCFRIIHSSLTVALCFPSHIVIFYSYWLRFSPEPISSQALLSPFLTRPQLWPIKTNRTLTQFLIAQVCIPNIPISSSDRLLLPDACSGTQEKEVGVRGEGENNSLCQGTPGFCNVILACTRSYAICYIF